MRCLSIILLFLMLGNCVFAQSPTQKNWFMGMGNKQVPIPPEGILYPPFDSLQMASATVPYPVVITESDDEEPAYAGWRAFNKRLVNPDFWYTLATSPSHWITYDCGEGNSNVVVTLGIAAYPYAVYCPSNFILYGSQDNATWVNVLSNTALTNWSGNLPIAGLKFYWTVTNPGYYRYYRLSTLNQYHNNDMALFDIQLTSAEYVSPQMTGYSNPSPYVVSADAEYNGFGNGHEAWRAFYGYCDRVTFWAANLTNSAPHWLKMDFGSNIVINGYTLINTERGGFIDGIFSGSFDDTNWVVLGVTNFPNFGSGITNNMQMTYYTNNTTAYRYYRLMSTTNHYDFGYTAVDSLQFMRYR